MTRLDEYIIATSVPGVAHRNLEPGLDVHTPITTTILSQNAEAFTTPYLEDNFYQPLINFMPEASEYSPDSQSQQVINPVIRESSNALPPLSTNQNVVAE